MTRKKFIEYLLLLLFLPVFWLVYITTRKGRRWSIPSFLKVPDNFSKEITFLDRLIVIRINKKVQFLSNKCTHLGCKINKAEGNELVCPCHGSRFNFNGDVIEGPANKPLENYAYTYQKDKGEFIIEIKSS